MSEYRPLALPSHDVAPGDQRIAERNMAWINRGQVLRRGEPAHALTLIDLSLTGCRFSSDADYAVGDQVFLRLQSIPPIAAEIMWRQVGAYGCRFHQKIQPRLVRALTLTAF